MVFLSNLGAENNNKLLTDYNQKILTFYSIYDYFVLLKVFNTNTLNFHQSFKDKLYSHQPSHMHYTRHSSNSNFNIPLFNHSVGKADLLSDHFDSIRDISLVFTRFTTNIMFILSSFA